MITSPDASRAAQLQDLFDRLRRLALDENPLAPHGVTLPQLSLLDALADAPGCGVGALAEALGVTPPTISVAVRRLEAMGLLQRDPDPEDRRALRLRLTAQGASIQAQAAQFRRAKMRQVLAGLSPGEAEQLVTLLDRALSAAERREGDA